MSQKTDTETMAHFFKIIIISLTILQLRKAIEDVNSGNIQIDQEGNSEKEMSPQRKPLLNYKENENTVNLTTSTLSHFVSNSDIESGNNCLK